MNILKLTGTISLMSVLSACSYFSDKGDNTPPAQQPVQNTLANTEPAIEEVSVSETIVEEESITPVEELNTTQEPITQPAQAKVTLSLNDTELKSKQIIDWNETGSGFILFSWIPPKSSSCKPTTFPIKKYQDQQSLTYTKRSIYDANHKYCSGLWKVTITEKPNKLLAKATLQVNPQNAINNSSK